MLRDIEELPTQDVATMLNLTPTAVKVRLHRARQALSTLLRKEYASNAVTVTPADASNGRDGARSVCSRRSAGAGAALHAVAARVR
jgi:sigma-70-like protein